MVAACPEGNTAVACLTWKRDATARITPRLTSAFHTGKWRAAWLQFKAAACWASWYIA